VRAPGEGQVPGPNAWADDLDAAWVDEGGLHLRIREAGGRWRSVELSTVLPPEAVHVEARLVLLGGALDAQAVLGLFLYRDDAHEADIELSRWGRHGASSDAQFAVAPYGPGELHRFTLSAERAESVLVLDWRADRVAFEARQGGQVVAEWRHTDPDWNSRDGYRLHINLWLYQGLPPLDGKPVEAILREVRVE
jgi:hypothetical protein